MIRLTLLLLLALVGCARRSIRSAPDLCRQGRDVLRSQQYVSLLARVSAALPHVPRGSACYYQLRLLRAEILLEQRDVTEAERALDFEIPVGPQWAEDGARYRLCQANLERQKGNSDAASKHLDEAQSLAGSARAGGLLAEIALRRASLAMQKGKAEEAEATFRRVLDEAVRRNDPYMQMKAKGNIGYVLMEREHRYEEAIPWLQEDLKLAQELRAIDDEARARLNLGWCYYRLSDPDKARQYFEEASGGFRPSGNRRDSERAMGDSAAILLDKHEYQAAAEMYTKALAIASALNDRPNQASCLNNLAEVAIERGDWSTAEYYNNEAWGLWKEDGHWKYYSMVKAGRIATGRGDFAKADQFFRSVIAARPGDPVPLLNAHAGRAFMLAKAGKNQDAEAEYRATDAAVEQQRTKLSKPEDRLAYLSGQIDFYQEYVDFIMAQNRARDALAIAESSRARALLDRLGRAHAGKIAARADAFQQVASASGGVLLSYWVAPDRSYLWAVTSSGVTVCNLPGESRIRELVKAYDDLIQAVRDPRDTQNPVGKELYDTLLAPVAGLLQKKAKVIIVPDGPLYGLNFETLLVPGPAPHYWIEDVTISITPSLDLLSLSRAARNQFSQSLLLIGNPISPVAQYPDLQFAGQEMDGIRKLLPAFRQVVWERAQAEPAVYARSAPADFGYIHFVAHAVANSQEPLESAVILSSNGTVYRLRARDVLGTPLHAMLVTVSACRSAGARVYAGEGLVGFPWAFLEAGARNVIAGLWDVSDRSTAELMSRLYAGIARRAEPASALRDAKLAAIHAGGAYQKPYYWGPFELFTRQAQ